MSINHLGWQQVQNQEEQQKRQHSIMEPHQNYHPPSKPHKPQIPHDINSPWASHFHNQHWLNTYNPQDPMFLSQSHSQALSFNLNQDGDKLYNDQTAPSFLENPTQDPQKEPMFEKPLTPSDVGKLNRLVIPKQHAEKYFPLGGDSGDKGLLLTFEDESGKCWRFRYSYWNSSQSYVLTKGWSRYVKEKQLDAGDVILFERDRTDSDRFFIGWRRRGEATASAAQDGSGGPLVNSGGGGGSGGSDGWSRGLYQAHPYLGHVQGQVANVPYQPDCLHAAAASIVNSQAAPAGNSKKLLRLFGVNLECDLDDSEPSTPDSSSFSSQGPAPLQFSHSYSSSYMDITFPQDINQMRNRRG